MSIRFILLISVISVLTPLPALAQTLNASLEVGTARMTYADSIEANSTSISPAFRISGSRASLSGQGTLAQLRGATTNSGRIDAMFAPLILGGFSTEISALGGGSSHSNGTRTGQMMGSARLHYGAGTRGAWAGGGVGRTWDGVWRDVLQADAGGWLRFGNAALVASIAPTVVDDSIRYADGYLGFRHEALRWDLDASLGYRAGQQLPTLSANRSVWGAVGATWWLANRVGLVAMAGTYPVDFTQGYPGGKFVSMGARVRSAAVAVARRVVEPPAASRDITAFSVRRVAGDTHAIRVHAPKARSVEVTGDFTLWSPIVLRAAGNGWWMATLPIERGRYELNVRIDGGAWVVPPGTTPRSQEFGGPVGVLVVR